LEHLVRIRLARPLLKQLVGTPVELRDLSSVDLELHRNLVWLRDHENVEDACLDFTVTQEVFGVAQTIELKPGGEDIEVTDANKAEYVALRARYQLLDSIRPQLGALLKGFYTVVPEELISVFDFQELELLMCGLPKIDMADWRANTICKGGLEEDTPVVRWFWEAVTAMSEEQRARLLQFATGTASVPVAGFAKLQGRDGKRQRFCLNGIPLETSVYPVAHTCFNRIDLPLYTDEKECKQRIGEILLMEVTGFQRE
jgi:E3 ubiquitin ligase SMURF1/2/E3 ubiquitin-protein ligase NEDD4